MDQGTFGNTGGGTVAAQTVTIKNVEQLSDLIGVSISYFVGAGMTNDGPATLSVNGFAPQPITRMNSGTLLPLGGGEMPAGKLVILTWDGIEYILLNDWTGGAPVGTIMPIAFGVADPGYALCDGAVFDPVANSSLFAKIGTTFGGTAAAPLLPDARGCALFGQDNMGGTAAGLISVAGGTIDGTIIGNRWSQQSKVVGQANLAPMSFPAVTTLTKTIVVGTYEVNFSGSVTPLPTGVITIDEGDTSTWTTAVTSNGGNTPLPTLSNALIVGHQIKL